MYRIKCRSQIRQIISATCGSGEYVGRCHVGRLSQCPHDSGPGSRCAIGKDRSRTLLEYLFLPRDDIGRERLMCNRENMKFESSGFGGVAQGIRLVARRDFGIRPVANHSRNPMQRKLRAVRGVNLWRDVICVGYLSDVHGCRVKVVPPGCPVNDRICANTDWIADNCSRILLIFRSMVAKTVGLGLAVR